MKQATAKLIATTPETQPLEVLPPPEISWDRARALWGEATKGAESLIELSFLLMQLKNEFFSNGGRPSRNSSARGGVSEKGWEQTVEEQLGINQQRARRLIEKGDALFRLKCLSEGEEVEWKDSSGKVRLTEPSQEKASLARELIPDVVAGLVSARRAWAGVCGEGSRSEISKQRADVDHAGVMLRAIRSVRAALKKWNSLQPEDRAEVERAWVDLIEHAPSTWKGFIK